MSDNVDVDDAAPAVWFDSSPHARGALEPWQSDKVQQRFIPARRGTSFVYTPTAPLFGAAVL